MMNHHPREESFQADPTSLARAYVDDFESVAKWYAGPYDSLEAITARADELLMSSAFARVERPRLVRKLKSYMRSIGAPDAALDAATLLGSRDVFAVVTGQQPGLAGGPLMLANKVAHAIKLAKELTEQGTTCVPVFWAASEDHDIDEVNLFTALNDAGKLAKQRIASLGSGTTVPLEKIKLPPPEDKQVQALIKLIPEGPHHAEALSLLRESFGTGFGQALNRVLLRIFGEQGLVVLEPRLLRDLDGHKRVIEKDIRVATAHHHLVRQRSEEIRQAGFNMPLEDSPYTGFFYISRGKRKHVLPQSGGLAISDEGAAQRRATLLAQLDQHPERFSSGVRLRPVVQGACLPTLAYVGGPGEIAYHAALKPLFDDCSVPMPLIVPRWSYSCLEREEDARYFEVMRTELRDAKDRARQAGAAISETLNESRFMLDVVRKHQGILEPVLSKPMEKLQASIEKSFKELRGRTTANPLEQLELSQPTRERAKLVFPALGPQERIISLLALWPNWRDVLQRAWKARDAMDFALHVLLPEQELSGTSA